MKTMKTMKNLSKALLLVLFAVITACSVDAIDANEVQAQEKGIATEKLNSNENATQRSMVSEGDTGGLGNIPSFTDNFTPTTNSIFVGIKVEYATTYNPLLMSEILAEFASHPNVTVINPQCADMGPINLYRSYYNVYLEDSYNLNEALNIKHADVTFYSSGPVGDNDDDDADYTCVNITDLIITRLYGN